METKNLKMKTSFYDNGPFGIICWAVADAFIRGLGHEKAMDLVGDMNMCFGKLKKKDLEEIVASALNDLGQNQSLK